MASKTRIVAAAAGGVVGLVGLPLLMAWGVRHTLGEGSGPEVELIPDRLADFVFAEPEAEPVEPPQEPGLLMEALQSTERPRQRDAKMERAKGNQVELAKETQDRQIAENAGVLGALREGSELDGVSGSSGLSSDITGGIGGLIGAKGIQIGAGGLGSRGAGLGSGGSAEGLGGLGTRGLGSGASGYGAGGGTFGVAGLSGRREAWPQGRQRFVEYGTNDMILVSTDPLSTFSIDVDTASYAFSRRRLQSGLLPPTAAVRVEEFVNALDYDYAGPDGERPFAVHLEAAPHPWNSHHHILRVGIQADKRMGDRPPAHLTFLVDTSGSMSSQDKLPLAQWALHQLVEGLGPQDTVALGTYAGSTRQVLDPTPVSEANQRVIHEAIDALRSGGGTDLGSGMTMAYDMAGASFEEGAENRVIVLSDGDANIGATSHEQMLASIKRYAGQGITMTTVGFGTGNYQDALMEQLANDGDGTYHYIDGKNEARKVFGKDLAGTLKTVARDVKIQVDFHPEAVYAYRLVGYENRDIADEDFRNDEVDAGEIGTGHDVTALYEVVLRDAPSGDIATVRIRAKKPGRDVPAREWATPYPVDAVAPSFGQSSRDLRMAWGVASFAELLRDSPYAEELSYEAVAEVIVEAQRSHHPEDSELLGLVKRASGLERSDATMAGLSPGATGGDPIILGAVDRSLVDEVIRRHMNQIRYCYQRELTRDPFLGGKLVTKFVIAKDGSVSSSNIKSSTMANASVESCVAGRFMRMQFPQPRDGGIAIVSYPFLFVPG